MFKNILLSLSFLFVLGCGPELLIGAAISVGIMWKDGEATKYYASSQEKISDALKSALEKYKLPIKSESEDSRTISIVAGDEDRFKVKIIAVRDNVTKLSIRVNIFGDKEYANMVYRYVDNFVGVDQFATTTSLNEALKNQKRIFR